MKHYKFIALLISACMAFSCTGMLDEDPTHRGTAETFYSTPDGLNAAVIACYSSLRLVHKDKTLYMTGTDIISNSASRVISTNSVFTSVNECGQDLDANNKAVYTMWQNLYKGINICNLTLINGQKTVPDETMSEQLKQTRLAEATFIRSLYYYYLVQQFGDVPYMIEPVSEVITTAERTPEETIMNDIIEKMEESIKSLPENPEAWGRITKGAGLTLLSKLYLARGYKTYKHKDDFSKAAQYADEVINSQKYALLTGPDGFEKLFWYNRGSYNNPKGIIPVQTNNEKNSEIILSIQFHDQQNGSIFDESIGTAKTNYGNNSHYIFRGYSSFPGMDDRPLHINYHLGSLCETPFIYYLYGYDGNMSRYKEYNAQKTDQAFDFKGSYTLDKRFDGTFDRLFITAANVNASKLQKAGRITALNRKTASYTISAGDTCLFIPRPGERWPQDKIDASRYTVVNDNYWYYGKVDMPIAGGNTETTDALAVRPFIKKFMEEGFYYEFTGSRDMFMFRLGEVYLLAAEAYLQSNNLTKALERVNTIRRRASGARDLTIPSELDVTSNDLDIDFILDERARELFGEELRWLELKRTGKLVERTLRCNMQAGHENAKYLNENHNLRPLPYQWFIRLSNHDEIKQNPGY